MRTSTRLTAGVATCLTGFVLAVGAFAQPASAGVEQRDDKVTICHRTNSNANPYIAIETAPSGQDGGTDHFGEHTGPLWNPTLKQQKIEWGDVIPPSEAHPLGSQAYQELGEGADGFIENGCATEAVPTFDVTLDKVTTGGSAPSSATPFTFTVTCDSGRAASPVSVAPDQEPLLVGDDVAEGDRCTITETVGHGAASVAFQISGGTVESTTAESVTFSVGGPVAVVATNAYPTVQDTVVTQVPTPTTATPGTTATPTTLAALPSTAAAAAAAAPAGAVRGDELARTGANAALTATAAGLVALGSGIVLLGRDRRASAHR